MGKTVFFQTTPQQQLVLGVGATKCLGPHKKTALGLSKTLSLIDEAAALTPPGHSLFFGLSGHEIFLDLEQLLEVIRHGASLNAEMSCVANAFWATTEPRRERPAFKPAENCLQR